ncbi:HGGxSTG domain-containing protein [Tahibacter sp.]|uniref:HGGxSTG domain-containing protein n=1 Tax=Tahibacter sp. TaxID=2056211 RepID=UPI0039C8F8BE
MASRLWMPRCGARTRNGGPCNASKIPGRKRCKWHGGLSTGPRTAAGKLISLRNLVQNRRHELNH